jgi:hypothetical protein
MLSMFMLLRSLDQSKNGNFNDEVLKTVISVMFLQALFCLLFDQLLVVNSLFLIAQRLQCKNI